MKDTVLNRFLKYVVINTRSDESSESTPSTSSQFDLAHKIESELKDLGLKNVVLDEKCYLTALLPGNDDSKKRPVIGFISHMDTSPDCSGENVKPNVIRNYDGSVVKLGFEDYKLDPADFPALTDCKGHDIITTDGSTLLGADDKAGCCEIVSAVEYLINHPEIKHGDVLVGFTPDEEIGRGADFFPLDRFKADWAYTVDGGALGELEYENFNAASATVEFTGTNIHPGSAKNSMVNSMTLAARFHAEMPQAETPEHTEGYEGFFHLTEMEGTVEKSKLVYIIRDFTAEGFARRKNYLLKKAEYCNSLLGENRVKVTIKESYLNMYEKVKTHMNVIELAQEAMKAADVAPKVVPIRGGTDGARLSYMGLPCPNLFTGGHNFHGRHEFADLDAMQKAVETIINIAEKAK